MLIAALLATGHLAAQPDTLVSGDLPRLTLKLNVTALLNPAKQALALATDVRLAPWLSVDAGVGGIFNSSASANQQGESYYGWRLRAGFKCFTRHSAKSAFHVGLEGRYENIRNPRIEQVLRQGGQYVQILPVTRRVQTHGLALRVGWYLYTGAKRRMLLEPFLGMGTCFHRVRYQLPPDAELTEDRPIFSLEYPVGFTQRMDVLVGIYWGLGW